MRSAVWERKLSHFQSSSSLAREFRRALFELQLLNYPDPTPSTDLKALEKLIDTQPEDAEDCRKRLEHLKEFRKQKKRA